MPRLACWWTDPIRGTCVLPYGHEGDHEPADGRDLRGVEPDTMLTAWEDFSDALSGLGRVLAAEIRSAAVRVEDSADWTGALGDVLPDSVDATPSDVATYIDTLQAENERLRGEVRTTSVDRAFYELTVMERDAERREVDRLRRLLAETEALIRESGRG